MNMNLQAKQQGRQVAGEEPGFLRERGSDATGHTCIESRGEPRGSTTAPGVDWTPSFLGGKDGCVMREAR